MKSWKRGFLEIIGEILDCVIENPLKKTHITFRCNLDSRAVTKYINVMQEIGLITKSKKEPSYFVITEKGLEYRDKYHEFVSLLTTDYTDDKASEVITKLKPSYTNKAILAR